VADLHAGSLLEIAAGTGIVTRVLARVLPETVAIIASDISQEMLNFAAAQPRLARIRWTHADALALPFEDAAFDAVLCQFGVMFFRDRLAGYRQARRVLKLDGRFVFNVWDRIENNEFCQVVSEAMTRLFPNDPPDLLARTPYGYFDTDLIRARADTGWIRQHHDRNRESAQCCPVGARSGDRLLPRVSATQRNRRA
jgi:SAM-dependent methyltransferase